MGLYIVIVYKPYDFTYNLFDLWDKEGFQEGQLSFGVNLIIIDNLNLALRGDGEEKSNFVL